MNKKLFLMFLIAFSATFLNANRPLRFTHAHIPRYFGMTSYNKAIYIKTAIISHPDLNNLTKIELDSVFNIIRDDINVLKELESDQTKQAEITKSLNEQLYSTEQGLDQAADTINKALRAIQPSRKSTINLYTTLNYLTR